MSAEAFRLGVVLLAILAVAGCQPSISAVKPENIVIAVDKDGNFYWNGEQVSCAEVSARLNAAASKPADAPKADFCGPLDELESARPPQE